MVNLQQGQVIKNYKELCVILDEPVKTGKSKQLQLCDWDRYFTHHKEGNKFIIDEVFTDPKPKIDNRCNNGGHIGNTRYDTLMDDIIIDILLHQECEFYASFTDMFRTYIPLITEEYKEGKINGFEYLQKKYDMSIGLINTYSNKMKDMIKGSFETALNRLQKQGLLYWTSEYIILRQTDRDFADEEKIKLIKNTEKEAYEFLKMKPFERINQHKNQEFRDYVIKCLQEEDSEIFSYWKVYSIQADASIEKIIPQIPNIKELTNRYLNSIHEKVMDYVIKPKNGSKPFKPYAADKHIKNLLKLDLLFWEQYEGLEHGFTFDNECLEIEYYYLEDVVTKVDNDTKPTLDTSTENINIGTYDNQTGVYFPF